MIFFGDYDDFIPNVLLGSGKEIDILLLKYDGDDIIWYQIIELKQDEFTMDELKKLIIYEKEIIRNQADNPLQVYPIAIARKFNEDVINYVNGRLNYMDRPIKLISYYFNNNDNSITLNVI